LTKYSTRIGISSRRFRSGSTTDVTLVDVEVVEFFLRCEQQGIRIAHCPAYVREWMAREKRPR
jgi:hypothetical protein